MRLGADALTPGPATARQWLREELARSDYHESLTQRFWHWVQHLLSVAQEATSGAGGLSTAAALVLLLLLVVAVALVLSRLQRNAGAPATVGAVFGATRRTAADHRALAARALEQGAWDTAVVESMRALAAGLVERGLLGEDAGATAHEVTAGASRIFPGLGDRLERAALVFDETRYGGRPADEAAARDLAALERDVRAATVSATRTSGPVAAVPR